MFWRDLGLLIVSSLAALGVCEGGLRLFWDRPPVVMRLAETGLHRPDPELGWRPRPNFSTIHKLYDHYSVKVSTNSRGFRDSEHAIAAAPGVKRVVILGDSFTFGWGVNDGEAFADRLRPSLAGTEIINMAVTGWNLKQYRKILELEGLSYRPDVVLLAFVQNDVSSTPIPVNGEKAVDAPLQSGRLPRLNSLYTYDLFRTAVVGNRVFYGLLSRVGMVRPPGGYAELDDNLRPALKHYPEPLVKDWNETLSDLRTIQQDCAGHGARLVVATIPARQSIEPKSFLSTLAHLSYRPEDFDLEKPYRELGSFCQKKGIDYINGWAALHQVNAKLFIANDMHLNARGHQEFARVLAPRLGELLRGQALSVSRR